MVPGRASLLSNAWRAAPIRKRSGIIPGSTPAARFLDHLLLLRLERNDVRQTLVSERRAGLKADGVDGQRVRLAKGVQHCPRYVARRWVGIDVHPGAAILLGDVCKAHAPQQFEIDQ